jgi:hypothetical protein
MKFLREPLLHFVALGALLFMVFTIGRGYFASDPGRRIEITESDIVLLAENFKRTWQRPPTEQELRNLVEARVREEVLYREALAVGLDENDSVVRRRMVQKMEMLSQDLALLADPTDQELREFFQERQESYRIPPRMNFSHIYFNSDRRGPQVEEEASRVLADILEETPVPRRAPERGDQFLLRYDFDLNTPEQVEREFGRQFAESLFELERGWHGPIISGYGYHLVHVDQKIEGRIPILEEVREKVLMDYTRIRAERAKEALYKGLADRYEIAIDSGLFQLRTLP